MKKASGIIAVCSFVALAVSVAHADLSAKVQTALRGQIIIINGALPQGETDADTVAAIKKARLTELTHSMSGEDVAQWSFDFTAFLKAPPRIDALSLDFYTADKARSYAANKRFTGIDPTLPIVSGTVDITEDDGLNKGKRYLVKLTGQVKGKEVVFARTEVTLK